MEIMLNVKKKIGHKMFVIALLIIRKTEDNLKEIVIHIPLKEYYVAIFNEVC